MVDVSNLNKGECRALAREYGLDAEGFGSMNVQGMRAALLEHQAVMAATGPVPLDPVDGLPGIVPVVEQPATEQPEPMAEQPVVAPIVPVVPPPVARPARAESFGVKQPAVGTICRQIWDYCEAVYQAGEMPKAKALRAWGAGRLDDTTMTVQFYRWRKFHGIGGRQA